MSKRIPGDLLVVAEDDVLIFRELSTIAPLTLSMPFAKLTRNEVVTLTHEARFQVDGDSTAVSYVMTSHGLGWVRSNMLLEPFLREEDEGT